MPTNHAYYEIPVIIANAGYGVVGPKGTNVFRVTGLSAYDVYATSFFLDSSNGGLAYHPNPDGTDYEARWPSQKDSFMPLWEAAVAKTAPTLMTDSQ